MIIKKRYEINGRIINNGDLLHVEYNPAEHLNLKENLIYKDGALFDFNGKQKLDLECQGIYIDSIEFIDLA